MNTRRRRCTLCARKTPLTAHGTLWLCARCVTEWWFVACGEGWQRLPDQQATARVMADEVLITPRDAHA